MAIQARAPAPVEQCPALDSGDRLDREEFERRYAIRTDVAKAELVQGVVYVASPVRSQQHGQPHAMLITRLGIYRESHSGVILDDNAAWRVPGGSEVQPDAMLRYSRAAGGGSWIDDDGFVAGVPELVAEVAASSASYDLHDKRELYRAAGLREYVVWRTEDGAIDWWTLEGEEYIALEPGAGGMLASGVFAGLELNVALLLRLLRESAG
ncbi:MAG: Uma2 family endonuclease [Tepidiformaceae bacterium]